MGSESSLWVTVRRALMPYGFVQRIENLVDKGTPDVLYSLNGHMGVLELKHETSFPARPETPFRIASLTLEQVAWAERWGNSGGEYHMLAQVGRDYFLFTYREVRLIFLGILAEGFRDRAVLTCRGRLQHEPLLRHLLGAPLRL